MTSSYAKADLNRFPEWAEDKPAEEVKAAVVIGRMTEIDTLAKLLSRETEALVEGDLKGFDRLQPAKRTAIRAVERVARSAPQPGGGATVSEALRQQIEALFETAERNASVLTAMKNAVAAVKTYAIEAIERQEGDGLYDKQGPAKTAGPLSNKGVHVKL